MTHVTLRPEFETLIDPYAPVGQVGTGFDFTEGPIWHPVHHYLLFSDMPGDVRRRWDAKRGVVEVKRPSNKCNGMTYDAELNLIVCEHATSSLDPRTARRQARGDRLAFREPGAQQPERCLRAFERRDLFQRSLVWPHAGLRRRAAAPARLPGRLSRAARRRPAEACGRPPSVRPAQRPLLLARRAPALCQRHRAGADPRLRRRSRWLARQCARLRQRHPLRARARPARRHEVRPARQYLGHRARRRLGLFACRRIARQGSRARTRRQPRLGRA